MEKEEMKHWESMEATIGMVSSPFQRELLVCQRTNHIINSQGFWYCNPLDYAMPVLMFQITSIFFTARILFLFLKPLRPSLTIAYILAGMVGSPSLFGKNNRYLAEIFPPEGITILMTFSELGFMIHLFAKGVQVDTGILRRARSSELLIGTMCFFSPFLSTILSYFTLNRLVDLGGSLRYTVPYIAVVNSLSSFPVITSLLTDLRILNSDLGRFATHVSLLCDTWTWSLSLLAVVFHRTKLESLWSILLTLMFVSVVIFIIGPVIKRSI